MGQYGETVYLNISSFTGLPSRAGGALHACMPCGEGKGEGREELIDTPPSLSLPISADCLSVCGAARAPCLSVWRFGGLSLFSRLIDILQQMMGVGPSGIWHIRLFFRQVEAFKVVSQNL